MKLQFLDLKKIYNTNNKNGLPNFFLNNWCILTNLVIVHQISLWKSFTKSFPHRQFEETKQNQPFFFCLFSRFRITVEFHPKSYTPLSVQSQINNTKNKTEEFKLFSLCYRHADACIEMQISK